MKQTKASINLGNQTYERGYADGLANRPKSIKKSHAHAHRYHAGHRRGVEDFKRRRTSMATKAVQEDNGVVRVLYTEPAKKQGLLARIAAWIRW